MSIRPLRDNILIKPIEETTSKGGIVIPQTATEKPMEGVVVAVGPGKQVDGRLVEPQVKQNDRVLYGKYAGTEVKIDGDDHIIMREEDVMGVIEG